MGRTLDPERERDLVRGLGQDAQSFNELYHHYLPRVYAYVAYRVDSDQDAQDVTSETFLRVVEASHKFVYHSEGSFAGWVFRIAYNLVQDYYRRQKRGVRQIPLEDLTEIRSDSLLPEEILLSKERFAELRDLIGTLPPRRQEVVLLKFYGGLRNREIAEVLGLSEKTVASHLCRGVRELYTKYVGVSLQLEGGERNGRTAPVD